VDDSVSDTPKGRFPKSAHLLRHSDFQRVYQQGRRHFSGNMTVFFLRSAELQGEAKPGRRNAPGSEPSSAGTQMAGARMESAPQQGVRIGFTVSKALGGAVERNRMRRRTREAVRLHLRLLSELSVAVDVVINPKKSLLSAEFSQISQEVERAFGVIRRACESGSQTAWVGGGSNRGGAGSNRSRAITKPSGAGTQRSGARPTSAADATGSTSREAGRQ
jgi:ribonuclease P protein component